MKILVTAKALSLNRTSEGICTSKFIAALAGRGHDVVCLTSEPAFQDRSGIFKLSWLGAVPIRHVGGWEGGGFWARVEGALSWLRAHGKLGGIVASKLNTMVVYATGFEVTIWREVARWREAIGECVDEYHSDVVFVRAAGSEFYPHLAMVKMRLPIPWVANYHDPFPMSLYPEPYRRHHTGISERRESWHRRIIRQADALTFPSRRLLEWVLSGPLAVYRTKASVVPHLAMDIHEEAAGATASLPGRIQPEEFTLVHAGMLLSQRNPAALVKGFVQFLGDDPEKKKRSKLMFIGPVKAGNGPLISSTDCCGSIQWVDQRVTYEEAMRYIREASVAVIVEADAAESPFFPAKLSDYIMLRKPILALSPRRSTVADIIGQDNPLRIDPADAEQAEQALQILWDHWKEGRMSRLACPEATLTAISPPAVVRHLEAFLQGLEGKELHRARDGKSGQEQSNT